MTGQLDLRARLAEEIPTLLETGGVTGLSAALVEEGEVTWAEGFGLADRETVRPVTPETIFQAASLSKPVFAYGVLRLRERGELLLNRPLTDILPEPYLPDEPRLNDITARRVLCHTPGLPNWRSAGEPLRIHFPPGERFSYSGEGYVYLQRTVEHLKSMPLDTWIDDEVIRPLGMTGSSYVWQDRYGTCAARGYDGDGKLIERPPMTTPNAAYSLYTTPSAYAQFVAALLGPAKDDRRLSRRSVDEMLTPHIPVNDLAPWNTEWPARSVQMSDDVWWGLGWGLQVSHTGEGPRGDTFWHWGDNGPFASLTMADRARGLALVAMANSGGALRLWPALFALLFGERLPALDWLLDMYEQMP